MNIKRITQQDSFGCGLACIAMIAGQTYQQVRSLLDAGGYYDVQLAGLPESLLYQLLHHKGYSCAPLYRHDQLTNRQRPEWPAAPFAPVHIARVTVGKSGHFVVVQADGTVLDPCPQVADETPRILSDYAQVHSIIGVYPIVGHPFPTAPQPSEQYVGLGEMEYVHCAPEQRRQGLLAVITGLPLSVVVEQVETAGLADDKIGWTSGAMKRLVRQLGYQCPARFVPFKKNEQRPCLVRFSPTEEWLRRETIRLRAKTGDSTQEAKSWWNIAAYHLGTIYSPSESYFPLDRWQEYNPEIHITSMLPVWK